MTYAAICCARSITYKLPMNKKQKPKHKYIPERFKNVESFSFTTMNDELMVVFHGFDQELDMSDFADYLFSKIGMNYHHIKGPPTIH